MVYLCAINDVTVPILKVHLETAYLVGIEFFFTKNPIDKTKKQLK